MLGTNVMNIRKLEKITVCLWMSLGEYLSLVIILLTILVIITCRVNIEIWNKNKTHLSLDPGLDLNSALGSDSDSELDSDLGLDLDLGMDSGLNL